MYFIIVIIIVFVICLGIWRFVTLISNRNTKEHLRELIQMPMREFCQEGHESLRSLVEVQCFHTEVRGLLGILLRGSVSMWLPEGPADS